MAESQVERIEREIEKMDPAYLKTYVLSKAREFESLRKQYESQLSMAKDEIARLGKLADKPYMSAQAAAQEGYKSRDREWVLALGVEFPDSQVAIEGGLIEIPQTLKALHDSFLSGKIEAGDGM
jgi:hypothetical protein